MSEMTLDQPAATFEMSPPPESTPNPVPANETTTGAEPTDATELDGLLLPEEQQADPDEVEEEFEGLKLRGKKDQIEQLRKERMLHADYTRKTQTFAEERKTWESERAAETQLEHDKFQFWQLNERAKQLQQVDFSALRQTNPELAESLRDELAKLSAVLPQMGQTLAQKTHERKLHAERENANRVDQANQIVAREVKGWGQEKLAQFVAAGQRAGIEPDAMRQLLISHPQASRFINKALAYDQLLAQRLQKAKAAPPPPKPVTRVGGGGATTTKSTSDMTPAEYAEWRRARQKR